jgi:4-hydroxyphenylpyruvate dioxygenase
MQIDCIHFYVADATRMRNLLVNQIGLEFLEQRINEHSIEYLVGNSQLLFSISAPLNPASPVAEYLQRHPSGVKNISFRVEDLGEIRSRIQALGLKILATSTDRDLIPWLKIQGWGSIEHTIIQAPSKRVDKHESIVGIDHLVLNVAVGELDSAASWYRDLFDFQVQQTFDIQTNRSGLTSKALVSAGGEIRFNINQPSSNNSQIQEFLDLNRGAGIQHIALETTNIFQSISYVQQQKLACLSIPATYYTELQLRAATAKNQLFTTDEWQQLQQLQILADWTDTTPEAVLLQIFTHPIFESPTFFFEIIERRNGAIGFGRGNFQALFEAIEQSRLSDVV